MQTKVKKKKKEKIPHNIVLMLFLLMSELILPLNQKGSELGTVLRVLESTRLWTP